MILAELQDLGLKDEEARIYLAVLELGGTFVSAIAKKAKVHRVNSYKILEDLVQKGLVSRFNKNGIQCFAVESPKILVQQQEEKLKQARRILPELLSMTNSLAYKPKIQYYEGAEGVKNIFEDTLSAQKEMVGYTNLAKIPLIISESYLKEYARRKIEKRIKTRMLSPLSKSGLNHLKKYYPKDFDSELVEIFFINPDQFPFEYEINIYENRVSLISLNPQELMGMIIESPLYAKTQRAAFNLAWLGATTFVVR